MEKITFVIPSRNNLEFLQLAYKSIRNKDKTMPYPDLSKFPIYNQ